MTHQAFNQEGTGGVVVQAATTTASTFFSGVGSRDDSPARGRGVVRTRSTNARPLAWTVPFSGNRKRRSGNPAKVPERQHLVLVGGGHAHVQVIKALNKQSRPQHLDVTLIDIQESASYSGMVPGCLSNIYSAEDTLLHLRPLAQWAGIKFIKDRVVDIDLDNNKLYLQHSDDNDNHPIPFDAISIDIGSTSRGLLQTKGAKQYTLPTRPISELVTRFESACQELQDELIASKQQEHSDTQVSPAPHVVVIGGGAAGIELSMSVMGRFKSILKEHGSISTHNDNVRVTLLDSNNKLLPSETDANRNALVKLMEERGIDIRHHCIVDRIDENHVVLKSDENIPFTHCLWATGASAHDLAYWLGQQRNLAISSRGWIQVNQYMQSISHPNVFAAGDCSTIVSQSDDDSFLPPPKAGVYAVRAGPILIQNLIAYLDQNYNQQQDQEGRSQEESDKLVEYHPQDDFLKLLVCGDGTALGFRFGFPIHGKWVMQLKDAIDQKFMNLFREENLPDLSTANDDDGDSDGGQKQKKPNRYDTSQYDATYGDRPEPLPPKDAATYLQRTDDDVDYMVAWNILRDMADDENYRGHVIEFIELPVEAEAATAISGKENMFQ